MKIKFLLFAFPALCLTACGSGDTTTPDASEASTSPYLAKSVSGVRTLSTDANYQEPCALLGEELLRSTFDLDLTTKLEQADYPNGCTFEWEGNKVSVAFGGGKPYGSIYEAEYSFDKMYQGKGSYADRMYQDESNEAGKPNREIVLSGPDPSGTGSNGETGSDAPVAEAGTGTAPAGATGDTTAKATPDTVRLTKPAVSKGRFVAVPNLGDKAVWDPTNNAIHVLYNNHIINVMVNTKGKPAMREEHARLLAEVLIDKVAEGEYKQAL